MDQTRFMRAACLYAQPWIRHYRKKPSAHYAKGGELDRRQGWRGALGRLDQTVDLDAQLAEYTKALPDLRYAALVTDVHDDRAEIYVNGQMAAIPFELAKWAYPPRRPDGVRPLPLTSLKEALAIDDIIALFSPLMRPRIC